MNTDVRLYSLRVSALFVERSESLVHRECCFDFRGFDGEDTLVRIADCLTRRPVELVSNQALCTGVAPIVHTLPLIA